MIVAAAFVVLCRVSTCKLRPADSIQRQHERKTASFAVRRDVGNTFEEVEDRRTDEDRGTELYLVIYHWIQSATLDG